MLFMFAGWFDHGKAAVLEQDREETGMSPGSMGSIGWDKLNSEECCTLLSLLGQNPTANMKKSAYVDQLQL